MLKQKLFINLAGRNGLAQILEIMNLENLNLVELNAQEVQETEGGFLLPILAAIATACIADWDNFERGLRGEPCGP